MKRLISVLLVLMTVFSMATVAFAAEAPVVNAKTLVGEEGHEDEELVELVDIDKTAHDALKSFADAMFDGLLFPDTELFEIETYTSMKDGKARAVADIKAGTMAFVLFYTKDNEADIANEAGLTNEKIEIIKGEVLEDNLVDFRSPHYGDLIIYVLKGPDGEYVIDHEVVEKINIIRRKKEQKSPYIGQKEEYEEIEERDISVISKKVYMAIQQAADGQLSSLLTDGVEFNEVAAFACKHSGTIKLNAPNVKDGVLIYVLFRAYDDRYHVIEAKTKGDGKIEFMSPGPGDFIVFALQPKDTTGNTVP